MEEMFYAMLKAGFHGSIVILAVLVLRLFLKKTPRKFICILWILAFVRLLLPISLQSDFSVQPVTPREITIESQSASTLKPAPESDVIANREVQDQKAPVFPEEPVTPVVIQKQVHWDRIVQTIWFLGAWCMWIYGLISYGILKNKVRTAFPIPGGYACDRIETAFVLGYFSPKIYIPTTVSQEDLPYILSHERTHLEKGDHWTKLLGFLALSMHWYNPLVWLAFLLFSKDTELACDEHVVRFMELEQRKKYAGALVNCSVSRRKLAAFPVAFGEVSVKQRILSVLKSRKPSFWISLLGVLAIAFVAVCLMTQPREPEDSSPVTQMETVEAAQTPDVTLPEEKEPLKLSGPETLWVVMEKTTADGMNGEARRIAAEFAAAYPGLTVDLEILPAEKEERAQAFASLREKMVAGEGPDVFLLPTRNVLTLDEPQQYTYQYIEPLFSNVDMAMRHGEFADLSPYWGSGPEGLNETVMNAGKVGDQRYVIPLRYNLPVIYSFDQEVFGAGMRPEDFDQPIEKIMEMAIASGNPYLACGAEYRSLNGLGQLLDYDAGKVLITREELINYLRLFQELEEVIGEELGHRNRPWLMEYTSGMMDFYPAKLAQLDGALTFAAISQIENKPLSMHPVLDRKGEITASVSYYGAAGKNCRNPQLAAEFLKCFLTEDSQFEAYRGADGKPVYPGLLEQSFPVRSSGAVPALWESLKRRDLKTVGPEGMEPLKNLQALTLSQEAVTAANVPLDHVIFGLKEGSTFNSYWYLLSSSNPDRDSVDLMDLADTILEALKNELIYP